MTDSRTKRVKALFEQALDLPRERREGFLGEACGSDPDLEHEVRSLVEAHQESEGFLESGEVGRALVDISTASDDPLTGAVIGDYRVLGLLARGGMGAVYRAEQEHPHREVALKLIDRAITTPENLRRFEIEAEVLARLKHPGIAQIHVAGNTGAELGDRPYFAMELVDGLTLTDFADDRELDLHDRLELLIKVCEAVQHAHRVGVIHRDLKPANILVTPEGQPKILDFGIARSTDRDLQVTTLAGQTALIGTLPYMSPEQVRGDPDELDTRLDVHALGVLGYELLTGRLPRDLEGKTLTDAIRTIVDEEPRSLRAAAGKRFPADLETIVAKALESDRHRRYDSVSALAADLRRFLDGQPISARPQSTIYQLRKLIARHRLPAALVAGLIVLAVASAVITGLQAQRTARERDRARVEGKTAVEVAEFLESLFLEADPVLSLGEELTARDILDRGAERIRTELADQPAVRGRLLAMLGKIYNSLGVNERATPLLEEAVTIGRGLREEHGRNTDRSNLRLALCILARCYGGAGRNGESIALCREAVELSKAVHGTEHHLYATSLNHLVFHLTIGGAFDEARILIERALELRERILGPEHYDTGWSEYQYAYLLRESGDLEGARRHYERAYDIWQESLPANHPWIAMCLGGHSLLLARLEKYDEALVYGEKALEIQRKALGPKHPSFANSLNDVGYLCWQLGDLPRARRYFAEAVEAHKTSLGPADYGVIPRLYTLAFVHDEMGRLDEEEAVLLEIEELARTHHGDSPAVLGEVLAKQGYFYGSQRRFLEAIPRFREAVGLLEEAGDPDPEGLLKIRQALASMLSLEGEPEEALGLYRQVLAKSLEHPDWEGVNPVFARWDIGLCLVRLRRFEEAETHLRELLPEVQRGFAATYFPWNVRWLLAHSLHGLGRVEEARTLYDAALGVDPTALTESVYWLMLRRAEDHAAAGRMDDARRELREALDEGLPPRVCRQALRGNPRLGPEAREELFRELDAR